MSDRLTAMEVESREFRTAWRGADGEEVRMFLQSVGQEMQRLHIENAAMAEELGALRDELNSLREREQTLQNTLVTAQRMTDELRDEAKKTSDLVIQQARIEGQEILREAQRELSRVHAEIGAAKLERENLDRDLQYVLDQYGRMIEARRAHPAPMSSMATMSPRSPEVDAG